MNADPNDKAVIKKWEETKRLLNSHIRLELFYSKQYCKFYLFFKFGLQKV